MPAPTLPCLRDAVGELGTRQGQSGDVGYRRLRTQEVCLPWTGSSKETRSILRVGASLWQRSPEADTRRQGTVGVRVGSCAGTGLWMGPGVADGKDDLGIELVCSCALPCLPLPWIKLKRGGPV